jgi:hypothetical protein
MARNFIKPRKHETGRVISTKTPYGVTSDMIVKDDEVLNKLQVESGKILVKDDMGYFYADEKAIDSGLAYPVRYSEWRYEMNDKIMEALND